MTTIIKIELDGEWRDFELLGRWASERRKATHGIWGNTLHTHSSTNVSPDVYLRLIAPQYTRGGVTYEETGEKRGPEIDEVYLKYDGIPEFAHAHYHQEFRILRPVRIVEES